MKEFLLILRRFIPPYKKYLVLTVLFNKTDILSDEERHYQHTSCRGRSTT